MGSRHGSEEATFFEYQKPGPGQNMQAVIIGMELPQWIVSALVEKYPDARILLLTNPPVLGENLPNKMVSTAGDIGQNYCPVVLLYHCYKLGGLIAMQIGVRCLSDCANAKLPRNMETICHYITPHGSVCVCRKSPSVEYLNLKATDRTGTERDITDTVKKDNKFYIVTGGRQSNVIPAFKTLAAMTVSEPGSYVDHVTVFKFRGTKIEDYLCGFNYWINKAVGEYFRRTEVDLSVDSIGIEGEIEKTIELLERPQVSMVGLFGVAGVGKTTLSKSVYNCTAFKYEKSCYLDVSWTEAFISIRGFEDAIEDVQWQLFRGIFGGHSVPVCGRAQKPHLDMIKDCLLTEKVFVVIDGVSSVKVLRALQVFWALEPGSQSKVVVTGEDSAVLPSIHLESGKVVIQAVNGIKDGDGSDMKLFLRHAFKGVPEDAKVEVNSELLDVATSIVGPCNGVPACVEALGRYLGNVEYKDLHQLKEVWAKFSAVLQRAQDKDGNMSSTMLEICQIALSTERLCFLDELSARSSIPQRKSGISSWLRPGPDDIVHILERNLSRACG